MSTIPSIASTQARGLALEELRRRVMEKLGLRLEPQMTRYLADAMATRRPGEPLPVIGADARTGVARREMITEDLMERLTA